jgi:hypothetical protein
LPTSIMAEETEELEVSFRLDEEGRTVQSSPDFHPTGGTGGAALDYTARTERTALRWVDDGAEDSGTAAIVRISRTEDWAASALDELLLDAEISDCGLMPRTFWVPAPVYEDGNKGTPGGGNGFVPRFSLEQLALDVFNFHTSSAARGSYDPATSGAEWWVQIRPSPEGTGRYSMHAANDDHSDSDNAQNNADDCVKKGGISFHWDKDEDLRLLTGGNTYVHPHLSTVTYLTGIGAPTLAINFRVHNLTGDPLANPEPEAFVSWPAPFKHLAFDGRHLHAAPADLMEDGAWDAQTKLPQKSAASDAELKKMRRRHRRVTFLVNIWLNYHPFNVHPFPETMIDKMSGAKSNRRVGLSFLSARPEHSTPSATTDAREPSNVDGQRQDTENPVDPANSSGQAQPPLPTISVSIGGTGDDSSAKYDNYMWPMGNYESGERIRISLPTRRIRSVAGAGGNVQIRWNNNDTPSNRARVVLLKGHDNGTDDTADLQGPSSSSQREDDTVEPSPKRARESAYVEGSRENPEPTSS